MKTSLVLAAALVGLGGLSAVAQQPAPTSPPANPPAVTTPAPGASTGQIWYTQTGDEMRASKLVGTSVQNTAGERIGEINEVIIGTDGRVQAVVLGIGGFLGIGEREVAVTYSALNLTRDARGNAVVKVNATRDVLQNAPRWTWRSASK